MRMTRPRPRELHEQFVINEEPSAFIARLAMVVGKKGYVLRSESDQTAIFNREETKFVGLLRGITKKYVSTIIVKFSVPNDSGQRTVAIDGDDGSVTYPIRQAAGLPE